MERVAMERLVDWKESLYRKPLIVKGIRQVGKTWLLKEFGRRYYDNIAYFNFDENPEYRDFFVSTKDVRRVIPNLAMAGGQEIIPGKTLLIFDEVQDCPEVLLRERTGISCGQCWLPAGDNTCEAIVLSGWQGGIFNNISHDFP